MSQYLKNLGALGEQKACFYLKEKDFSIINRNFKSKFGEIDIIAEKNRTIYFIEVKTRSNLSHGAPYEAVNYYKLRHLKKTADYFLLKNPYKDYKLKIAVISILLNDTSLEKLDFFDNVEI